MNRAFLTKSANTHEQRQHAYFNRLIKNILLQMKLTCIPNTTGPDLSVNIIATNSGVYGFSGWSRTGYHPIKINFFMMKCILLLTVVLFLLPSCKNKETEAFAYGNFETEEIIVSAESSGKINEFTLIEGMTLKPADYIGYIDTTQFHLKKLQLLAGIKSVNAKLTQIDKQLVVNEVSMRNLVREKNRIDSLLEGGAATPRQLDDIIGQIDLLNAQTEATVSQKFTIKTEVESLDIQIMQINDFIAKSLIKSPTSGTVLEKYLYEGELAVTGKPLFKMADVSYLILRVFVSGSQIEQIKIGSEVSVYIDTENKELKEYNGIVSWISDKSEFTPKIIQTRDERVNLVYAVKIRVKNDGSVKIGMPGEIRLVLKSYLN